VYIFLLLVLFLCIYTLLGMQLFAGLMPPMSYMLDKISFDSFIEGFLTCFQIMTVENWNNILHAMYGAQISLGLLVPFLISWIFIGNFTLLNLLMAILLDGFDSDDFTEDMNILEAEFEV